MRKYKHYKDSGIEWIGEIPEHWERYRIKYMLSRSVSGVWGNNLKGDNNDTVCFRISDFDYVHGCLKFDNLTMRNIDSKQLEGRLSKEGDLIIEKSGGGNLWPVGRVVRVNSNLRATCSNFACLISARKNISSNYLYYYFYCMYSRGANLLYFNQTTGIQNLNIQAYLGQEIFIPLLPEQQSIANYLDKKCDLIDRMIGNLQKKIELLKELKSSVISQAVTKGLDPHVKMKDSGIEWIGEIPEHWEIEPFKRYLREPLKYGANEAAESDCKYWPRYIRITDIDENGKLREETFKSLSSEKARDYILKKGDILFARSGATVGKTYIYNSDSPACYAGYLIRAECNENLYSNFIYYYTKSGVYENWKNSISIQSTIQNIGADKYSLMPVILPPLPEQQSIANYLDKKCEKIDSTVTKAQRKIDLLKEYKTALISEVVTGKRKVSA
jgi:type I restriction enzyme S subunit